MKWWSPSYSVTYVTVQTASPSMGVYVASPAYSGMMVAWGCAVSGTGYYEPLYVYARAVVAAGESSPRLTSEFATRLCTDAVP